MICKNCGAKIGDHELVCPYCGFENEKEAKKRQEDYIDDLNQKKKELSYEPEKKAKIAQRIVVLVTIVVVILVGISITSYALSSRIKVKTAYGKQQAELEKLEELYNAKEYEEMHKYFDSLNKGSNPSYEKYYRVDRLSHNIQYIVHGLSEDKKLLEIGIDVVGMDDDLKYLFDELKEIRQYEEEDFPYGEEEGVLYYKEFYMNELKNVALLSEEEIEEGLLMSDYSELANVIKARWGY